MSDRRVQDARAPGRYSFGKSKSSTPALLAMAQFGIFSLLFLFGCNQGSPTKVAAPKSQIVIKKPGELITTQLHLEGFTLNKIDECWKMLVPELKPQLRRREYFTVVVGDDNGSIKISFLPSRALLQQQKWEVLMDYKEKMAGRYNFWLNAKTGVIESNQMVGAGLIPLSESKAK